MAIIGIYAVVFKLHLLSSRNESEGEGSDGVEDDVADALNAELSEFRRLDISPGGVVNF